jgi:DNA-directed RNA polymerase specialized sigma24 family protein
MLQQLPPAARRLAGVLAALAEVRRTIDSLEHEVTMLAREAGCTWEDIGEALGISRQAARSRLGAPKRRQR